MRSEFVSVHDYADQLAADSWGDGFETAHSASLLEWAEGLGVCFLQGQQLELAVVGLAVELKLVAESASCRKTIGQLLGLIKPSISADDFQVLDRAVKVRNRFVHGSLWIGLSELRMRGWWEEIGVDLWSYRDENCLVEQRAHGRRESGTEYLELWIRELASATRRAVGAPDRARSEGDRMNKTGGSLSGPEYLRAGLLSFLISRIVSPRLDSEFLEPIANAWTRRPAMSALARSDV